MSEFQYSQYRNPYLTSISELMMEPGKAQARAAQTIGNAQANAAMQSGQAWGNAASNIGQSIAAIPGQIQHAKTQQQEQQIRDLQLKDVQQRQAGQAQLDTLMQGDQLRPGDVGPRQESYTDANGLFDVPKLTRALAQSGIGHLAPELLKGAESINESITKHQAIEAQAAQAKTVLVGDLADGALKLVKLGMPVPDAMDFVAQPALATQRIHPQEYAQIREQIANLPPEQQQAALGTFMDAAAKLGGGKTLAKDAVEVDRYNRPVASNVVPDKPTEATLDAAYQTLIAKRAKGQTLTPDEDAEVKAYETRKPPPQTTNEWKDVLLDGKPAKVFVDPKTKVVTDLSGHTIDNPIARIKPVPAASITIHNQNAQAPNLPTWATDDSRPTGPDANKVDPSVRMTPNGLYQAALNNIATGQFPPTGRGSDRASVATRTAITSKVGAIAASAGMDEPALRAFYKSNAASLAQQQKSLDAVQGFMATADRNADLLKQTLAKIPDTGSPLLNVPIRAVSQKALGSVDLSQFKTYVQSVQNEYARIISQPNLAGQLTDSARKEAEQLIDPNATVSQIVGSIDALRNEGANRLLSIGEQIQRIQQRMQGGGGATPPAMPTDQVSKTNPFR